MFVLQSVSSIWLANKQQHHVESNRCRERTPRRTGLYVRFYFSFGVWLLVLPNTVGKSAGMRGGLAAYSGELSAERDGPASEAKIYAAASPWLSTVPAWASNIVPDIFSGPSSGFCLATPENDGSDGHPTDTLTPTTTRMPGLDTHLTYTQ